MALCLTLLPVSVLAEGAAPAAPALGNGGWPYGRDMSSSQVTLVMEATGEGLSYQWQSRAKNDTDFANVDGATGAELPLSSPVSGSCMDRICSNEKCGQKCQLPGIHAAEARDAVYR